MDQKSHGMPSVDQDRDVVGVGDGCLNCRAWLQRLQRRGMLGCA